MHALTLLAMSDANMHDLIEWGGTILLLLVSVLFWRWWRD